MDSATVWELQKAHLQGQNATVATGCRTVPNITCAASCTLHASVSMQASYCVTAAASTGVFLRNASEAEGQLASAYCTLHASVSLLQLSAAY